MKNTRKKSVWKEERNTRSIFLLFWHWTCFTCLHSYDGFLSSIFFSILCVASLLFSRCLARYDFLNKLIYIFLRCCFFSFRFSSFNSKQKCVSKVYIIWRALYLLRLNIIKISIYFFLSCKRKKRKEKKYKLMLYVCTSAIFTIKKHIFLALFLCFRLCLFNSENLFLVVCFHILPGF